MGHNRPIFSGGGVLLSVVEAYGQCRGCLFVCFPHRFNDQLFLAIAFNSALSSLT